MAVDQGLDHAPARRGLRCDFATLNLAPFDGLNWPHLKAEPVSSFWGLSPEAWTAWPQGGARWSYTSRFGGSTSMAPERSARWLGVHRREVRKALARAVPAERKKPARERPKLAPAQPFIDAILEADRRATRKQRHIPPRHEPAHVEIAEQRADRRALRRSPTFVPIARIPMLSSTLVRFLDRRCQPHLDQT